jgi:alpha-N-arabinofuranosidase
MVQKAGILLITVVFSILLNAQENTILIKTKDAKDTINRNIYGHFAEHLGRCIYDGFYVGRNSKIPNKDGIRIDVVEALKELQIPVLRWPGGCFAEQYQWKDGIGTIDKRPPMVNYSWGGVTEDNSFGTHEFLELCEMLGAEPYIAVNIASGTVKDAKDWIEYVNSDKDSPMTRLRKQNGREKPWNVKYWGIGNENWGCGGSMNADYYADVFKRYSTYCPAKFKIGSGGNVGDYEWTRTFMSEIKKVPGYIDIAHGFSYHYYSVSNWTYKGKAIDFNLDEWFSSMYKTHQMSADLEKNIAIMDELDPDNKIALIADEWGSWYEVEEGTNPGFLYQQNTLRDAVLASIGLNIFNNHCKRVKMANIAQTVNVLQSMILTKNEQMLKTPTYYLFKMYKVHQDALLLPTELKCGKYTNQIGEMPVLSVSASQNKEGIINITVSNVDPQKPYETIVKLDNTKIFNIVSASIITADKMNAFNDFGKPEQVNIKEFKAFKIKGTDLIVSLPAKSVVHLALKFK